MDTMVSSLGKTWNGSDFDFKNASGFYSGLNNLSDTVTKNAKIVQGKTEFMMIFSTTLKIRRFMYRMN